ncbi:MAG: FAD-dependent oxidoreductase, partial [Anaerolineae bacterium]|nr:FAD-dependent oxidoreductase [Anaerolineae bacterium]
MAQRRQQAADTRAVIIGAGVGGLTTAALLAGAGLRVTVLEAHVYPGGCAGTFFHKGYRFDAGATLAGGFYPGGPLDIIGKAVGIERWPVEHSEPAMIVHLPDGQSVSRWSDDRRWQASEEAFGPEAARFWRWQEATADALWDLALRNPAWPPQTPADLADLSSKGLRWLFSNPLRHANPALALDALLPLARHLRGLPEALKLFVDAQTLIAAQTTSDYTYGLFGASALDLPRRGVAHPERGIGAIAETLAEAVRRNGGEVRYRQEVLAVTPRA